MLPVAVMAPVTAMTLLELLNVNAGLLQAVSLLLNMTSVLPPLSTRLPTTLPMMLPAYTLPVVTKLAPYTLPPALI